MSYLFEIEIKKKKKNEKKRKQLTRHRSKNNPFLFFHFHAGWAKGICITLKLVDNLAKGNVSDVVCFYVAATV